MRVRTTPLNQIMPRYVLNSTNNFRICRSIWQRRPLAWVNFLSLVSKPRTFLLIRTNVTHNQPTNANNMTHISFPFEISHQSVSQSVMMARKPWCREPDRDSEAQRIGGEARASGRPPGELSIERKLPLPVDVHQLRRGCRRRTHRIVVVLKVYDHHHHRQTVRALVLSWEWIIINNVPPRRQSLIRSYQGESALSLSLPRVHGNDFLSPQLHHRPPRAGERERAESHVAGVGF